MDRQDFVAGVPKPPRPNCSTEGCDGLVYSDSIRHCEKCVEVFNSSISNPCKEINIGVSNMMTDTLNTNHFNTQADNPFNRAVIESLREEDSGDDQDAFEDDGEGWE
jgi:hypothetical protein